MVVVGEEQIQGDAVTHYPASSPSLGHLPDRLLVDGDGIVRRSLTVDTAGGFEIARDYLDLGLDVRVEAPTSPEAKLEDLVG